MTVAQTSKKNLQKSLQEKIKQLKGLVKDTHFAESLIDEILSLKGQLDVEATELYVRSKDVIEVMDFDSVKFEICTTGVLFHAKSGYTAFIEPRCRALYGELMEVLTAKKRLSTLTEEKLAKEDPEQIEAIEQTFSAWVHNLEMPVASSISPIILFKTVTAFLKVFGEETDRILKTPLKDVTAEDLQDIADKELQEEALDAVAAQIKQD